nr:MAG TPA: hypothetical protein [Caudoviricetes sp.]
MRGNAKMAHLHNETVDGKNIVFYTDDNGIIWIRAFTLFAAAGINAPGAALRSYVISHPGTGQKFTYPGDATGDVSIKYTSPAWHFTYAEALTFLKHTRAPGRIKARKAVEATVQALTAAYLAPPAITPAPARKRKAAPAKAKPAPVNGDTHAATVEWLTSILADASQPLNVQKKALYTRAALLELAKETSND